MTAAPVDAVSRAEQAEASARRAPEPLHLVQSLVNTLNRIRGYDLLADVDLAGWWLGRIAPDLVPARVSRSELEMLRELREGLRGLLRSATSGDEVDETSAAALRVAGLSHPLAVTLDTTGVPRVVPAGGSTGADVLAARVLAALPAAAGDGTLPRLKACANPDCEWAFYDTSRSRSGSWCVMNLCGARHKMSRYRERQRANGNDSTDSQGPPT